MDYLESVRQQVNARERKELKMKDNVDTRIQEYKLAANISYFSWN